MRSGGPALEYAHFERFLHEWLAPRGLRPFRMELKIADAARRVCGSTDALLIDPEYDDGLHLILLDYKRVGDMTSVSSPFDRYAKRCAPPIAHLRQTKFMGHALQQNVYRQVIEDNSRIRITRMYLLVLHPMNDTYHVLEVPDLRAEITALFAERARALAASRADAAAEDAALCAALDEVEHAHKRRC